MATEDKTIRKFISFTGPSCSGKTTLVNQIHWDSYFDSEHLNLVPSHTRQLKKDGYDINNKGSDKTQTKIIDIHHMNYLDYQCDDKTYITDRCIIDGLVYTEWLHTKQLVGDNIFRYAKAVFDSIIDKHDVIFYCHPVEYKDDQDRKLSHDDHQQICLLFEHYISKLSNVIRLEGSIEERLTIIDNHI